MAEPMILTFGDAERWGTTTSEEERRVVTNEESPS